MSKRLNYLRKQKVLRKAAAKAKNTHTTWRSDNIPQFRLEDLQRTYEELMNQPYVPDTIFLSESQFRFLNEAFAGEDQGSYSPGPMRGTPRDFLPAYEAHPLRVVASPFTTNERTGEVNVTTNNES